MRTRGKANLSQAGAGVLLTALLLTGCSSGAGDRDDTDTGGSSPAVTAPDGAEPTPEEALTPVPPPAGSGDLSPVAPAERPTLPPVPLDQPGVAAEGLTVRVATIESTTVTGHGPGELSGPAVALTLAFANATAEAVTLDDVVVSVGYGDGEGEGGPVTGAPTRPASGTLAPGAEATGVYAFTLPAGRSDLTVRVSLGASLPVIIFQGVS